MNANGKLTFTIYNGATQNINSPLAYNDGNWHNVIATFTANSMILYVDGSQVAATTTGVATISSYTGYWRIGYSSIASSILYFDGSLDDVGIWNAVLAPSDVSTIYASGSALSSGWTPQWGSIQSVWHLDEATSPYADSSGNGNTATLTGNSVTSVAAKYSNGVKFIVPSSFYTTTSVTNPQTFSLSLWMKTTSSSGGFLIGFANGQSLITASYDRMIWMNNNGTLALGIYNSGAKIVTSPLPYNNGRWHYVVGTYTANSLILYVDGIQVASTTAGVASAQSYTGYWRMGYCAMAGWGTLASGGSFTGVIDEAAIWNVVLTPSQIQNIYTQQSCQAN